MDSLNAFDLRLQNIPIDWKQPIVDVVDTFDTVQIGLKSIGIDDPFLLTKAVELVLDRYDKLNQEQDFS